MSPFCYNVHVGPAAMASQGGRPWLWSDLGCGLTLPWDECVLNCSLVPKFCPCFVTCLVPWLCPNFCHLQYAFCTASDKLRWGLGMMLVKFDNIQHNPKVALYCAIGGAGEVTWNFQKNPLISAERRFWRRSWGSSSCMYDILVLLYWHPVS